MRILAYILTNIFFKLFYNVKVINKEFIPKEGPAILCSAHNSVLDMFFLGFKIDRYIHWMAKEELFRNPVLKAIFTSLGAFPVKRGKGDIASIRTALKLLQEGKIVGVFPQGTRVGRAGKDKVRAKPGAAMLAVTSGVAIIPALVAREGKIFCKVRVIYGKPFKIPEKADNKKYSVKELTQISNDIMEKIYSLENETF